MKPELRPYLVLAFILALADQISKFLIRHFLSPGESVQVLGDFLRFTFVYNEGGAFGLRLGNYIFYTVMAIAAAIVIIIYMTKTKETSAFSRILMALVIGGAIGNLIDRIAYGQVIDFIDVNIPDIKIPPFMLWSWHFDGYELERWFIFNIADSSLTIGLIGFLIYLLFKKNDKQVTVPDNMPVAPPPVG